MEATIPPQPSEQPAQSTGAHMGASFLIFSLALKGSGPWALS